MELHDRDGKLRPSLGPNSRRLCTLSSSLLAPHLSQMANPIGVVVGGLTPETDVRLRLFLHRVQSHFGRSPRHPLAQSTLGHSH